MIQFEHSEYWWLLAALAPLLLAWLGFLFWRARAISRIGDADLLKRFIPLWARPVHIALGVLMLLCVPFMAVGIVNPQLGTKYEEVKRQGIDVMIALDVSKSMLAEDVSPNRLLVAKKLIGGVLDEMQGDRVGMIIFAGNAYLQMPMTVDYAAGKMYLKNINTDVVPTQGTAIGEAVRLAMRSFDMNAKQSKALLIITDGENHEGDAVAAIKEAKEMGIIVHTIGVGTTKGSPIPIYDKYGNKSEFKRDKDDNIVLSKLNIDMLKDMAETGNGTYTQLASGSQEVETVMENLAGMQKADFEAKVFTEHKDWFQPFLIVALVLILIEVLLVESVHLVNKLRGKPHEA